MLVTCVRLLSSGSSESCSPVVRLQHLAQPFRMDAHKDSRLFVFGLWASLMVQPAANMMVRADTSALGVVFRHVSTICYGILVDSGPRCDFHWLPFLWV